MSSYSTNEFRSGLKIMLDNDPYSIVENEFVKPGKGQAFNRVRIRNLQDRPRHRAHLQVRRHGRGRGRRRRRHAVPLQRRRVLALHAAGDRSSSTRPARPRVGDAAQWLKEGTVCIITLWNGQPLTVTPPAHVELKIVETDPGHARRHRHRRHQGRRSSRPAPSCACRSSSTRAKSSGSTRAAAPTSPARSGERHARS